MKKLYLAEIFILLLAICTLTSCATTTKPDSSEQLIKTAIDSANEYCSNQQYELALEVYNTALEAVTDYRLLYNKALVLAYLGQYSNAIEVCKEGFALFDYIIAFKEAEAYYYTLAEDEVKACQVYLEILELNPYDTTIRNALIDLYKELGMYDKALEQVYILWNQGYKTSENLKRIEELKAY